MYITGLEDDKSDNLEKVWCFLENVRDPTNPESGCYPDVKWSAAEISQKVKFNACDWSFVNNQSHELFNGG